MADDKDITAEGGGGGKKKLIIIIAIALVLLLGGGGAAFFLLGGDDEEVADAEGKEPEAEVAELADPQYHRFDPVFVVNLPPGGRARMLQIAIEIMTQTPSVVDTLKTNDPMVRHHLINLLEQQEADVLLTLEGKQALQQGVTDLLAEKLKELKEPGEIKGVYFTQFVLQ
ncbi:MAG: flagellar basal body-associated FliL family protein [Gammaproteobacteria bacterium]|nr:flagellar basal body-associated FliL family protein [Gammaproteobacteria bacterium]MCB1922903.1 flagellar basal body-associated FliL family protein [Gammaproteobacteria bacterium]